MKSFLNYSKNRFLYSFLKVLVILLLGFLLANSKASAKEIGVGKNLFDISKLTIPTGSVNYLSGTITVNGYNNASVEALKLLAPSLVAGQTYTLSFNTTSNEKYIYLDGSQSLWLNGTSRTITEADLNSFIIFYGAWESTNTYYITNFQIEKGDIVTDYEPYLSFNEVDNNNNDFALSDYYLKFAYANPNYSGTTESNGINVGGTWSKKISFTSVNGSDIYFYSDLWLDVFGDFKAGNTYYISYRFNSKHMYSSYSHNYTPYMMTGSSYSGLDYKDYKATLSNSGKSGFVEYYVATIEFTPTKDFSTCRLGFTFDYRTLANNSIYNAFGNEGSGSSPYAYASVSFTNLTASYKINAENAVVENANTTKGIFGTVKAIFSSIGNLPKNIANAIGGFFSALGDRISGFFSNLINSMSNFFIELGNKVVQLGSTIINGIIDGLKSLFIPEDDYFTNWLNNFRTLLNNKLGFLTYPFELFANVINRFLNLNDGTGLIHIPEIKVPNFDFVLIQEQDYNLKQVYENGAIKTIHTIYLYFVDIILVISLVNLAIKKFNQTIGGDN